jgi:UDP-galactopyranose mutase
MKHFDFLIVGAGFAGSICAAELAKYGKKVLVIDKRNHIAGNAYDSEDRKILVHHYGPHIFHTNSKFIFEYLSQYTSWHKYEHRVLAEVNGALYPFPINITTINKLYNLNLNEFNIAEYFDQVRIKGLKNKTSEDVILSSVGADLCDKFFRGYTKKQWNLDLSELSASVASRVPARFNDDDRYFTDKYQYMPSNGYTRLFENMLDHENISIQLNTDLEDVEKNDFNHIIYTGPIDAFYHYKFGKLPYRSLKFEHEFVGKPGPFQKAATINYPNNHDYTRITEFAYFYGKFHKEGSAIMREYPQSEGDPYYPIPNLSNEILFKKYEALAKKEKNVYFVGRLAQYRYYNMDQVAGAALALVKTLKL